VIVADHICVSTGGKFATDELIVSMEEPTKNTVSKWRSTNVMKPNIDVIMDCAFQKIFGMMMKTTQTASIDRTNRIFHHLLIHVIEFLHFDVKNIRVDQAMKTFRVETDNVYRTFMHVVMVEPIY
jgi:hypothetical protein